MPDNTAGEVAGEEGNIMMTIVNMTPHEVTLCNEGGESTVFPSVGSIRLKEINTQLRTLNGAPVYGVRYTPDVEAPLPGRRRDTYYIVSAMVQAAFPFRDDFISPYGLVRDESGVIVGCTGWKVV